MDILSYLLGKKYTQENTIYPVDLAGQADGDYLRRAAGDWVAEKPNAVLKDIIMHDTWESFGASDYGVTGTTNTGNILRTAPRYIMMQTLETANSTAYVSVYRISAYSRGQLTAQIDFSKVIAVKWRIANSNVYSSNGKAWALWGGRLETGAPADPIDKAIGIRIDGRAVSGIVHDGTNLTAVDLSTNLAVAGVDLLIISDGAGNVSWYIDDVLTGSSAHGPTGLTASNYNTLGFTLTNNADEADNRIYCYDTKIYVEA